MSDVDWPSYLEGFHDQKPGITERVLARVAGSPYGWLAEPLQATAGWVADLACGSAPTRDHLTGHRWVGIDLGRGELAMAAAAGRGPLVRARADGLPVADGAVAAVCAAMSLQVVTPLPEVLAEVHRVLRSGGLLAALVPSRLGFSPHGWGWVRLFAALGLTGQPWPNPRACEDLPATLAAHSFEIVSSQRRTFWYPLHTAEDAALLVDGLYLPGVGTDRVAAARRRLGSRARPGRGLPLPLRRVLARR